MSPDVREAVGAALGSAVTDARPIGGGDINRAYLLSMANGARVFAKYNDQALEGFFEAEARGLRWLAQAEALRVPQVLAVSDSSPAFLVLELLEAGTRATDFEEQLGEGLARLHLARPAAFGLDHDNFIGRLHQSNTTHHDWVTFFRDERLLPQLHAAVSRRRLDGSDVVQFDRLLQQLPNLLGPAEPPARLHGDLWGGNVVQADGAPALIDPAVYGGHREMDLAMMKLFGGFGPRVFAAYEQVYPLAPGFAERVRLYQLYPLLVHVNLFGGGYAAGVRDTVARYAA